MGTKGARRIVPFMLVDVLLILTILVLFQVDHLVHSTLYSYDLRFSSEWAAPYWILFRTSLALLGLTAVSVAIVGYYFYRKAAKGNGLEGEGARGQSPKVVYVCSACGDTWIDLKGNVKINPTLPKPKFLKQCPSCNKRLLDK